MSVSDPLALSLLVFALLLSHFTFTIEREEPVLSSIPSISKLLSKLLLSVSLERLFFVSLPPVLR